jgi:beta-glucanase (GH16 family)
MLAIGYQLLAAPRWDVVWSDDFDGASGSAPSAQNWILSTGTSYPGGAPQWGTGEIQTYTRDSENVRLDGEGNLVITATRDAAGAWRSARLESARSDFQPPPGGALEVSARLKLPNGGRGYWGAFWMLGKDFRGDYTNWPGVGEIDIMEYIGRQPSSVFGTLHCGTAPGGPCGEPNGIGGGHTQPDGSALSDAFHTFSIQWDRSGSTEQIRWYLDGERFFTVNADDVDAATWKQATDHGFFVLLNLAIGGGWPGPPDDSTRPGASMIVDRVWVSQAG